MQVDGEPWRQPIPAAPEALHARRSFLRPPQGGGAATQQQPQPLVLRVSHAGHSQMLFNDRDPQVRAGCVFACVCFCILAIGPHVCARLRGWLPVRRPVSQRAAGPSPTSWPAPPRPTGHPPGTQVGCAGRSAQPGASL